MGILTIGLGAPDGNEYEGGMLGVCLPLPGCDAAIDGRRLISMLGVYVEPPYILVLRLPWKLPLPRPLNWC